MIYFNFFLFLTYQAIDLLRAFGTEQDNYHRTYQQTQHFTNLISLLTTKAQRNSGLFVRSGLFKFGLESLVTTCMLLHCAGLDCKASLIDKWSYGVALRIRRRRATEMKSLIGIQDSAVDDLLEFFDLGEQNSFNRINELISKEPDITLENLELSAKRHGKNGTQEDSSSLTSYSSASTTSSVSDSNDVQEWFDSLLICKFSKLMLTLNYYVSIGQSRASPDLFHEKQGSVPNQFYSTPSPAQKRQRKTP